MKSMKQQMTRRHFVQATAGFAAATGTLGLELARAASAAKHWPVACRDAHLKVTDKSDCWSAMKYLGVNGAEVAVNADLTCSNLFHPDKKYSVATPEGVQTLRDELRQQKLVITAFMMSNRFDERLDQELAETKQLVS